MRNAGSLSFEENDVRACRVATEAGSTPEACHTAHARLQRPSRLCPGFPDIAADMRGLCAVLPISSLINDQNSRRRGCRSSPTAHDIQTGSVQLVWIPGAFGEEPLQPLRCLVLTSRLSGCRVGEAGCGFVPLGAEQQACRYRRSASRCVGRLNT